MPLFDFQTHSSQYLYIKKREIHLGLHKTAFPNRKTVPNRNLGNNTGHLEIPTPEKRPFPLPQEAGNYQTVFNLKTAM